MKKFDLLVSSVVAVASLVASAQHAGKSKFLGVQQVQQKSSDSAHEVSKVPSQSTKELDVVKIGERSWKALSTNGEFFFNRSRLSMMPESELNSLCGDGFRVAHQNELVKDFANLSLSDFKKPAELPQSSEIKNDVAMHQYCSVADPSAHKLGVQKPAKIILMRDAERKGERLELVTKVFDKDKVHFQKPQRDLCRLFCVSR